MAIRTYVKVSANVDECGKITPLCLTFKGIEYTVDQIFDVCQAAAINAGGQGIRYSIRIGLHKTYLFHDDAQRWFVEEKVPHVFRRVGGLVATDCSYRFSEWGNKAYLNMRHLDALDRSEPAVR